MERFEQVKCSKKQIFINNFLGGLSWALGVTVGLAVIISVLGLILRHVNLIPFFGNFIGGIIEFIITKNPNLLLK
jgi:hypothetical protein